MEKEADTKKENKIISVSKETGGNQNIETIPESEEKKKNREAIKQKQNKQIVWAVVLMVSMIAIIIAVPYLRDNVFSKFNYQGMTFQKMMVGQLEFYNTKLPVYSQSSYSGVGTGLVVEEESQKKQTGSYELSLRKDPRELDNITVDLDINNITFVKSRTVYVTYNASDPICQHNVISAADLANFLLNFGNFDVKGAFMDKDYAEANKIPYVTCENSPDNTVIMVVAGNESRISKVKDRCYKIEYANCDMVGVIDKFILSISEGYLNSVKGDK